MDTPAIPAGRLLREWRRRRRLSQLDLATQAEVSQRHLSFIESGRALPSRDMVLRLAEQLAIPLRERNTLLLAAGYAPVYRARTLDDAPLAAVRRVVESILRGHEPHPAIAIDRHWNLQHANAAAHHLMSGVAPSLLQPPVNVLRLSLHPEGLAARIGNFREWRAHVFARLSRQIENSADGVLMELLADLKRYPVPLHAPAAATRARGDGEAIAVPLQLMSEAGVLHFLSTTTVFGTALDITLSELAIESFFPADEHTAAVMRDLAQYSSQSSLYR